MSSRKVNHPDRQCAACGKCFKVGGRGGRNLSAVYCSRECHQKSRYRHGTKCKELSDTDAAYIAGFFDGEGCVFLHKRRNNSVGLMIDCSGTSEVTIKWLHSTTGVGSIHYRKSRSDKHKQCYCWRVAGDAAESLLLQLLPYLKIKKPQAELGIEFQSRLRTPSLKADRLWQHEWKEKMMDMNKRGPRSSEAV